MVLSTNVETFLPTKVLASAFSNVGADNLAENLLKLGLKVVRLGKASAIDSSLWDHTLDAAIDRDPDAQKFLKAAAKATANIQQISNARHQKKAQTGRSSSKSVNADLRNKHKTATRAVKASIEVNLPMIIFCRIWFLIFHTV